MMRPNTILIVLALASSLIFSSCVLAAPSPLADDLEASSSSEATATTTTTTTAIVSESSSTGASTTQQSPKNKARTTTVEPVDDGTSFDFTSSHNTSTFTCAGKVTGYYADVKLDCRVYHFCTQMDALDGPAYQRMSYLCLEGSFFDQKDLNCVKGSDLKVPCEQAEAEYEKSNKQFDSKEESGPSMSESLATNIMMNPITRFIAGR